MKVATSRLHGRTRVPPWNDSQCGDVEEELEVQAAIVWRRERELLLTLRTRLDDQHHLTKAHWPRLDPTGTAE